MNNVNEAIDACNSKWGTFYKIEIDHVEMVRVMAYNGDVLHRCEDFEELEKYLGLK